MGSLLEHFRDYFLGHLVITDFFGWTEFKPLGVTASTRQCASEASTLARAKRARWRGRAIFFSHASDQHVAFPSTKEYEGILIGCFWDESGQVWMGRDENGNEYNWDHGNLVWIPS